MKQSQAIHTSSDPGDTKLNHVGDVNNNIQGLMLREVRQAGTRTPNDCYAYRSVRVWATNEQKNVPQMMIRNNVFQGYPKRRAT